MDVEDVIIECVKEQSVLYDPRERKYMDNNHKGEIWKNIAVQCGLSSGDKVKEMWKKLRDGYRSCKKRKASAPATSKAPLWKYELQMSFLQPFMKDRRSLKNSSDTAQPMDEETTLSDDDRGQSWLANLVVTPQTGAWNDSAILPTSPNSTVKTPASIKPCMSIVEVPQDVVKERPHKRAVRRRLPNSEDPLKMVFDSMYATTKTLPPHLQRKVKKQIFLIVADAEEEAENYYSTFSPQSSSVSVASMSPSHT